MLTLIFWWLITALLVALVFHRGLVCGLAKGRIHYVPHEGPVIYLLTFPLRLIFLAYYFVYDLVCDVGSEYHAPEQAEDMKQEAKDVFKRIGGWGGGTQ